MTELLTSSVLDECAREPIHIPGAIQPHGALVAVSLPGFAVTHISANCEQMLGLAPGALRVGQDLREVFSRQFMHDLGNTLQAASIARTPERMADVRLGGMESGFDVIAHANADGAICEFVPTAGTDTGRIDSGVLLRAMNARLARAPNVDRLLSLAAQQVRAVTGYDRVMIYKFLPDTSGVVIAESRRSDLEPYLTLHYPASDIPPQARELYRRQPLRQIPRVVYEAVPILPAPPEGRPLDLGLAHLRSVSPVHLEYLRNMGSGATLTISIMRGQTLWGLFACHHQQPRRLSSATCAAMELFAQMFSLQLEAREQAAQFAEVERAHAILDRLRHDGGDKSVSQALSMIRSELSEVVPHDGLALWIDGQAELLAITPPEECLPELVRHLAARDIAGVFASDRLSTELPDALRYAGDVSGVLAIPLSRGRNDYLMFFRQERVKTVSWGGDPNKPITVQGVTGRIGPRQSFSAWQEVVRGTSLPWRTSEIHVAEALQTRVLELMLSQARVRDDSRRAAAESQSLLVAELGHRVKNVLALIRSVVRQSRQGATSIEDYTSDLERRIKALAVAHDQVTHVGWRPASLRRLLEEQASTWSTSVSDKFVLEGPPVLLDVRALQAFALVLHEMMTNAAKYGALSVPNGKIAIAWMLRGGGLAISWRETGGPPVSPPQRRGFGTVVIEQTIPFEIKGTTDVRYVASGVEADFFLPDDCVTTVEQEEAPRRPLLPATADLKGVRILLVEDSMMIALDAQSALENIGAQVEIVSTVTDGKRSIALGGFNMALLDVNLRGETSAPLADILMARGVPFIFATGYGHGALIPDKFRHVPKISKPYDAAAIAQALDIAVAAAAGGR